MRLDRKIAQEHLDARIMKLMADGQEHYLNEIAEALGKGRAGKHLHLKSRLRTFEDKGLLTSREVHASESGAPTGRPRRYFRKP